MSNGNEFDLNGSLPTAKQQKKTNEFDQRGGARVVFAPKAKPARAPNAKPAKAPKRPARLCVCV